MRDPLEYNPMQGEYCLNAQQYGRVHTCLEVKKADPAFRLCEGCYNYETRINQTVLQNPVIPSSSDSIPEPAAELDPATINSKFRTPKYLAFVANFAASQAQKFSTWLDKFIGFHSNVRPERQGELACRHWCCWQLVRK